MADRKLPPLNALRAFEAAARQLSFTRAGEELHVTQAAISHQVKALEQWLGLALFRRRGRTNVLTENGQTYLAAVRESLDLLAVATDRLTKRQDSGVLTVTTLASFAAAWLLPRLGRFRVLHPDIDVRLSAGDEIVDFARDDVDVAIRYGDGHWSGVEVVPLMTEDLFPVCSPALRQGPRPLRRPEDLRHHTLLHDDMRETWRRWLLAAGVDGVDPDQGPGYNLSSLVIDAAVNGQGVALARSALVGDYLVSGRLIRLFDIQLPAEFAYYLVHPARALDHPKVRAFREWVLSEVQAEQSNAATARLTT
ncbi:MAG: transcriptional regulator GcvA [Alphaproteobacteria bacterium]|jgi:LysR family glycine cleavage system transcriptional activator|nr:transcriptional regulator [Rhodospirillaceae bacterium]MDP6019858.1 transcriptional regulator GcvA [Alphaproteobacteria bacterium]MDP6257121.1 transcriptional regulator GcvA [Alphaproteobacteria bacterium]MDP7053530.1 transcriptional regulator GcvA [Alphaproteobacteria bacterium]MDP7230122.1 transcriptional regulator GcvA [Alphaproteobacteria bacterium]|tara:strand:+ start:29086 stop:30009 length:924 start_codon:yes stop_codon:yes gene_type:complete